MTENTGECPTQRQKTPYALGTVYTTVYCPYNSINETRPTKSLSLTVACWVHSNVYALCNIPCVGYLTTVDSIHSTSSPVKIHYHLTSCSMEVPLGTKTGNPTSIGKEPVPKNQHPVTTIIMNATSSLVSYTEQSIITFTNVLQGHNTVVLVFCTSEPETDCTHGEEEIPLSQRVSYLGIGKMLHNCMK